MTCIGVFSFAPDSADAELDDDDDDDAAPAVTLNDATVTRSSASTSYCKASGDRPVAADDVVSRDQSCVNYSEKTIEQLKQNNS